MAIATKNVEEKDSKTVALISLLVTVFLYCCNCRSKYTSHTKKWCCLSNMCTFVHHTMFLFSIRYFSITHLSWIFWLLSELYKGCICTKVASFWSYDLYFYQSMKHLVHNIKVNGTCFNFPTTTPWIIWMPFISQSHCQSDARSFHVVAFFVPLHCSHFLLTP